MGKHCLDWVKWAPWKWHAEAEEEGDLPEGIPMEEKAAVRASGDKAIFVDVREKQLQDFSITKKDVENHRPTRGCAGCSSMFRNMGRQPHSVECRERFRELLRNEARVQHNEAKRKEFEQRELAKRERKIMRREEKREERGGGRKEGSPRGEKKSGKLI